LERLLISGNNIGVDALAAFASEVRNNSNSKLINLSLNGNASITNEGWSVMENLLCDTSSINATYLSNHNIITLGWENRSQVSGLVAQSLMLNRKGVEKLVKGKYYVSAEDIAVVKILEHHQHFDMQPFFQWEFKFLPIVIGWLEKSLIAQGKMNYSDANIDRRKLSSIYQFVRAMPEEFVEARLSQELETSNRTRCAALETAGIGSSQSGDYE